MQRLRGREGSGEAGKPREEAQRKEVQGMAGRAGGRDHAKVKSRVWGAEGNSSNSCSSQPSNIY